MARTKVNKCLVTGGAGFIGSNLAKKLRDEGRQVIIADDFSRGNSQNLTDLGIKSGFVNVDLRDYSQVLKIVEGVDTVFHLAARVGSVEYLHGNNIAELVALQTNLVIDTNVFKACMEKQVKKIVYASSIAVYPIERQDSPDVILSEEDAHNTSPEGGYGWSKLLGEVQLGWIKGIDVGIGRLFNIYGENAALGKSAHVIPMVIMKAIAYPEEEFIIWGDGKQTRDFVYVGDCVEALLKLEEKASNPPIVVNIGSGKATPISKVAEKVAKISGKNPPVKYDVTKPAGPRSRTADTQKAKALLGWQPKTSIDKGLENTYRWIQGRLSKTGSV